MTNQMAVGFLTPDELHELCQGIVLRLAKLEEHKSTAVEVGHAENIEYWSKGIDAAKAAQRKLLMAYDV